MTTRSLLAGLLLGLLGLSSGCTNLSANVYRMHAQGDQAELEVLNEDLQDQCHILNGRLLYEGEILTAVVNLRSNVSEKRGYEYRWRWFDQDGFEIEIGGGQKVWAPFWINPQEDVQLQERAPRPSAVRVEFFLRWMKQNL